MPRSGLQAIRFGATGSNAARKNGTDGAASDNGSSGCSPTMASSISATSATLRAMGPSTSSMPKASERGPCATRPGLGRNPTTEKNDAGKRTEPAMSLPVASQASPLATAAAEPPDDPPGVNRVSQGL